MAAITPEAVITRILRHLQLAAVPPPIAPARVHQEHFDWVASTASDLPCGGPCPHGPTTSRAASGRRGCHGGGSREEATPLSVCNQFAIRLSPAALPRGIPPTSPLAGPPHPRPATRVRPRGGRAAPPQPVYQCAPEGLPPRARRVGGCTREGVLPRRWRKNAFAFPVRGKAVAVPEVGGLHEDDKRQAGGERMF